MLKSPDAFRTISEVAEDLDLPQHVLRFWETRFPQIRPLKRAGGRRYYRPADVLLLRSIRQLLYDDGYTIKGVQRLLKEQGARSLRAGESAALDAAATSEAGDIGSLELDSGETGGADIGEAIEIGVDAAGPARTGDDENDRDSTHRDMAAPPPAQVPRDGSSASREERDTLREALAIIEDCAQILRAARHDRS